MRDADRYANTPEEIAERDQLRVMRDRKWPAIEWLNPQWPALKDASGKPYRGYVRCARYSRALHKVNTMTSIACNEISGTIEVQS